MVISDVYSCVTFITMLLSYLFVTASQTWTLGRLLPIMVGSFIPDKDIHWENFCNFLDVANYMLAPEVHVDEIAHLNVLYVEFLRSYTELYPEASVIPKFHYLLHVPRLMIK